MKIVVFSTNPYDREFLEATCSQFKHELTFLEARLIWETVELAKGFAAVCVFVNDRLDAAVLCALPNLGVRARCDALA